MALETEWGAQALLKDVLYRDVPTVENIRERLRRELASKGVTEVRFEDQRLTTPPLHDSPEFPDCPYAADERLRPGADADERPECGNDEHWLKGFVGWEINATGEA